jgi:hypothetical protein
MQSKWKTWPQQPKAIERPFSLFGDGFAWYSMLGSLSEFRQMAQVSAQMSQDHMQTCVCVALALTPCLDLCGGASAGGSRSPERHVHDGGGASLAGGQRAAFGVLSTRLLSKTLRARRGHGVIQHSTF